MRSGQNPPFPRNPYGIPHLSNLWEWDWGEIPSFPGIPTGSLQEWDQSKIPLFLGSLWDPSPESLWEWDGGKSPLSWCSCGLVWFDFLARTPINVRAISLVFSHYFPIISSLFPLYSLLFPHYFPAASLLFPCYFPMISPLFPHYLPVISLLFLHHFPAVSH